MPAPYNYLIIPEFGFPRQANSEETVEEFKASEYGIIVIVDMETGMLWDGAYKEWRYPSQV